MWPFSVGIFLVPAASQKCCRRPQGRAEKNEILEGLRGHGGSLHDRERGREREQENEQARGGREGGREGELDLTVGRSSPTSISARNTLKTWLLALSSTSE